MSDDLRHRLIIDAAYDAFVAIDPHGRITEWNARAASMFGRHREDAVGYPLTETIIPPQYRKLHSDAFGHFIETGAGALLNKRVEVTALHRDGHEFPVELAVTPIQYDDTFFLCAFIHDITQRKQTENKLREQTKALLAAKLELEAQKQLLYARHLDLRVSNRELDVARREAEAASRAKSEFLANISHELRTPITAILGFAEVLQGRGELLKAPPEPNDAVETIRQYSEHLLRIIDDILDLACLESGRLQPERQRCSPLVIVAEVASLQRVQAQQRGLRLDIEYDGPIPETIESDPPRLRQILNNLVGNAVKFTKSGGVRLITRFAEGPNGNGEVEFDVVDTGIGMFPEQVEQIFNPFTQADSRATRKFGGAGLGLAVSKRMAEMLEGDVSLVRTELGSGSHFRLSIPTGPLADVRILEKPTSAFVPADQGGPSKPADGAGLPAGVRVLIAEDCPDIARLFTDLLSRAGVSVTVVENGRRAVEVVLAAGAAGSPYHLIFMDVQMPEMDGHEATRRLRTQGYNGPIIALTAHGLESDRAKCLEAGCDDFATKPIKRQALLELVARYTTGNGCASNATRATSQL